MTTPATTRSGLLHDTRGAMMMTGLFFSFFLVGALWFVIGVGDSIVFRDRMQEAADHSAFTSAALHAKGMNFIAAINLIMLVIVVIHIILGLIHDITLVSCIVTGAGCVVWFDVREVYTKYASTAKPVLTGLHHLQRAAAYGYPYVGLVKSIKVGDTYGKQHRVGDIDVFAVSPSMVPDFVSGSTRVGLPVSARPMKALCEKTADWTYATVLGANGYDLDKARDWLDKGAEKLQDGWNWVRGKDGGSKDDELEKLVDLIKGAVPGRYCNDVATEDSTKTLKKRMADGNGKIDDKNEEAQKESNKRQEGPLPGIKKVVVGAVAGLDPGFDPFWGSAGPHYVDDSAKNGNFFMQVWALNLRPRMTDPSERKVKIASRNYDGVGAEDGPFGYFAQAEMYFDCKSTWSADDCNGEGWAANAAYSLRWRARLRKVAIPDFGELLGNYIYQLVTTSDPYKKVRSLLTEDNALYDKLTRGALSGAVIEEVKKKVDEQISKIEAEGKARLESGLQDAHDTILGGVYH